ncbi:MAG TPA: RNA polymerase sigma factor [Aggregatilinea sp.]|uniref:RNA polymerase sigma factor n=1 Tax=Aggregatilinea sp. TaxID=2806333 RepID=UPI002B89CC51|nr:RNA polymerase sigma factor [Aggregatilinea sp.]HML23985.1 RNA polymerase sigma factor [Aggregatilinea sp.]
MDERLAIAQLKKGDVRGLEVLVRRYQLEAVRIAFSIIGDQSAAEEVVQEAFIRVYQQIDQYDDDRPFRPWFLRIVANDAIKHVKRQLRLVSLDQIITTGEEDRGANPDERLYFEQAEFSISHDDAESMQALLDKLSFDHRAVLQLKYYMDMMDEEIAEALEIPVGTVKSRLHAAKRQIRCLLTQLDCVSWDR